MREAHAFCVSFTPSEAAHRLGTAIKFLGMVLVETQGFASLFAQYEH